MVDQPSEILSHPSWPKTSAVDRAAELFFGERELGGRTLNIKFAPPSRGRACRAEDLALDLIHAEMSIRNGTARRVDQID